MLGFLGRHSGLGDRDKQGWATYLQGFQDEDGMFRDPADLAEPIQEQPEWALRAHRTRHCAWAIESLGHSLTQPIRFILPLTAPDALNRRLNEIWEGRVSHGAWRWGNWIMDLGVMLDLQHRHFADEKARYAVHVLLDWLDRHQDPRTGYWYLPDTDDRNAMAGAMHLYPLYWAYNREVRYFDRITKETLKLQQSDGLFAYQVGQGGSQCLDYDAILILVNAYATRPAFRKIIRDACNRTVKAIAVNENDDGSWADCQVDEVRNWGTRATLFKAKQGSLWDAYARMMTVAMCKLVIDGQLPPGVCAEHHLFEIFEAGRGWRQGHAPALAHEDNKDQQHAVG